MPVDLNIDGYADHIVENLDMVMGNNVQEEFSIIAPGTATDKSQPAAGRVFDAFARSFFSDLGQWLGNQSYFAQNIFTTQIPILAVGYICPATPWDSTIFGFLDGGICIPYVYVVGYQTVQYGVNFRAVGASTHLNNVMVNVENIPRRSATTPPGRATPCARFSVRSDAHTRKNMPNQGIRPSEWSTGGRRTAKSNKT